MSANRKSRTVAHIDRTAASLFAKQATWSFVSRAIGALLQALMIIILARSISKADFGDFGTTFGTLTLLSMFTDFGLTSFAVKSLAVDHDLELAQRAVHLNKWMSVVLVAICAGIALVDMSMFDGHKWPYLIGIGVFLAIEKVTEGELALLGALQKFEGPAVSIVGRRLFALGIFLYLSTVLAPLLSYFLALALVGLPFMFFARTKTQTDFQGKVNLSGSQTIQTLRSSFHYGMSSVFQQIRSLDALVVSLAIGPVAAGAYSAATRLASPTYYVTSAVATAITPGAKSLGDTGVNSLLTRMVAWTGICISLLVACSSLLDVVMVKVYGNEYQGAGQTLLWVASGTLVTALYSPFSSHIQAMGYARLVSLINFISGILILCGICVGCKIGGEAGAALGFALAASAGLIAFIVVAKLQVERRASHAN